MKSIRIAGTKNCERTSVNGRAIELQLPIFTDFGFCRISIRLPPPQARRHRELKIQYNVPNNFFQESEETFFGIFPIR